MSLYEKYGGFAAIHPVVMEFYDQLLDDDDVGPYFDDIDMSRLIEHQTQFVSGVLGGPYTIDDTRLKIAHKRLGITPEHFERMQAVLANALSGAGFATEDVSAVVAAIDAKRDLIVVQ